MATKRHYQSGAAKRKAKNKELRMMPKESELQKNSAGKWSPIVSVVIC